MQLGQKQSQQQHPKYFMKTSRKTPCIKEAKWEKKQRVLTNRRRSRSSTEDGGSKSLFPASISSSSSSLLAEAIVNERANL
jgi:hypothetical protein